MFVKVLFLVAVCCAVASSKSVGQRDVPKEFEDFLSQYKVVEKRSDDVNNLQVESMGTQQAQDYKNLAKAQEKREVEGDTKSRSQCCG